MTTIVDLHCHILPNLDDGPVGLPEALRMARIAAQDGITDVVATPHMSNGIYSNKAEDVICAVETFQQALDREQIPLQVHPGAEVHIHFELIKNLKSMKALIFGNQNRYVLLEFPHYNIPLMTDLLINELERTGITPVIAHPERNEALCGDPGRLARWIRGGAIAQLTAGSLTGEFGKSAQKAAEYMVSQKLVHVIASDGHNDDTRRPTLSKAYKVLETLLSARAVSAYVFNAAAILYGGSCIKSHHFNRRASR